MILKRWCGLLLFLILVGQVSGVGLIAPLGGKTVRQMVFEPHMTRTFEMGVWNTLSSDRLIMFSARGDLAEYVRFNPENHSMRSGEKTTFQVTFTLPASIEPGMHELFVGALEAPPDQPGAVAVRTGVQVPFWIRARYPGRYAVAGLSLSSPEVGEPVQAQITVSNYGDVDLHLVRAEVSFYADDGEFLGNQFTQTQAVAVDQTIVLSAAFSTVGLTKGEYRANGTLYFDGEQKSMSESKFRIGELHVDITNHTRDFQKDIIQRFDIFVTNDWNQQVNDVYALVTITGAGTVIDTLKTPTLAIDAWASTIMSVYWDLHEVAVGPYDAKVELFYEGEKTVLDTQVEVFADIGLSDQKPAGIFSTTTLLMSGIIVLLILVNILLFMFYRRRESKGKAGKRKR